MLQLTEPTVGEKRCSECGEHKAASQFYKNRTNKDGLFGKCKLCSEGTKKERALNDVTVERKVMPVQHCPQSILQVSSDTIQAALALAIKV